MFSVGSFAKIFEHEDKGRYSVVSMATSKKDRETGEYKNDFSSKYVRFVGQAHEKLGDLQENGRIKILNCGVTIEPGSDGKWYTNFLVFDFENADANGAAAPRVATHDQFVAEDEDDLPY